MTAPVIGPVIGWCWYFRLPVAVGCLCYDGLPKPKWCSVTCPDWRASKEDQWEHDQRSDHTQET